MARLKKKKSQCLSLAYFGRGSCTCLCPGPRAGPVATLGAGLHPGAERENLGQQAAQFDSA